MQIYFKWTCRSCGQDVETRTDTSSYPETMQLHCPPCNHVSGELVLDYRFLEQHRPPHELEGDQPSLEDWARDRPRSRMELMLREGLL